ncbi:hypothetical protein RBH94_09605 [Aestuariibaculum sp. YM273]|uniref:hypothetical protein n=1 Tax=Aestuariibaculum sp. YM273 TaxID=3070659 RepID=UPI0027DC7CDA|nr:hypothetical protein [Aestuariibaculum sp. YM273]WMI64316.1 hypothetical protein RBH94_09605 [Aestuariibaculum sp. YM273]
MKKVLVKIICLVAFQSVFSQDLKISKYARVPVDSTEFEFLKNDLSTFLKSCLTKNIDTSYIKESYRKLSVSSFKKFSDYIVDENGELKPDRSWSVLNIIPKSKSKIEITTAIVMHQEDEAADLLCLFHFFTTKINGKYMFYIPLEEQIKDWDTQIVGNITYYYKKCIDTENAKLFDSKNSEIAKKLNVKPEQFQFFICEDYQAILNMRGFDYSISDNGLYRDGYGLVGNRAIFSVMGNEDFSHDIFHYYSGKINNHINRNWIAEKALAYLWGNAYYTDQNGNMILFDTLINHLKQLVEHQPELNLLEVFKNNTSLFDKYAPEVASQSAIAAVLAKEVEKIYGTVGVLKLINSGRDNRLENFLKTVDTLLGINEVNFNSKLTDLILQED